MEHTGEVELLHLFFETAGEAGVHARATREDDMLVELSSDVNRRSLDGLEEKFCRGVVRCLFVVLLSKIVKNMVINLPATPGCSTSIKWGWNMHSGASNRSEPTLMTRPSGS